MFTLTLAAFAWLSPPHAAALRFAAYDDGESHASHDYDGQLTYAAKIPAVLINMHCFIAAA